MKQPTREWMTAAIGIAIAVLFAVTVALYLYDPPPPYIAPIAIKPAALPGTIETNAGKAYRVLRAKLEAESGEQGKDLEAVLREDPTRFLDYYDELVRISRIEFCDWGVEPDLSALLPHASEVRVFSQLLGRQIDLFAADGDITAAAEGIAAMVRLAQHSATGFTMIEKLVSRKILSDAFDRLDVILGEQGMNISSAARILRAVIPLNTLDPLASRASMISERDLCVEAFERGYFAHEEIAGMYSMLDSSRFSRPPSYRQCRRAAEPYRKAMDILIEGWMTDDYALSVQRAKSSIGSHLLARKMFGTYEPANDAMIDLRDRIRTTVLTLESISGTDD